MISCEALKVFQRCLRKEVCGTRTVFFTSNLMADNNENVYPKPRGRRQLTEGKPGITNQHFFPVNPKRFRLLQVMITRCFVIEVSFSAVLMLVSVL